MPGDHCLLLRKSLQQPTAPPRWPCNVNLQPYDALYAERAYALLQQVHPADTIDWPTWQAHWRTNPEYDPALCLLVFDATGLVGLAHGWTSGYLKDLAVHPRARRQGLGEALLAWACQTYRQRGEPSLDLRVREDNQPALRLYQKLGMQCIRREPC